jgi:serine/threonine-protein kinase
MRKLDATDATPLPGATGRGPFISPDGQWVGYFDGATLKKVAVSGGVPMTICDACAAGNRGAAWGSDDTIIFTATNGSNGLARVPSGGGTSTPITTVDGANGEIGHV